jgi:hypothetical protein
MRTIKCWLFNQGQSQAVRRRILRTKCPLIKQLRKALKDGSIKIASGEFNIIDRRGDRLRCIFLLDLGVPGVA